MFERAADAHHCHQCCCCEAEPTREPRVRTHVAVAAISSVRTSLQLCDEPCESKSLASQGWCPYAAQTCAPSARRGGTPQRSRSSQGMRCVTQPLQGALGTCTMAYMPQGMRYIWLHAQCGHHSELFGAASRPTTLSMSVDRVRTYSGNSFMWVSNCRMLHAACPHTTVFIVWQRHITRRRALLHAVSRPLSSGKNTRSAPVIHCTGLHATSHRLWAGAHFNSNRNANFTDLHTFIARDHLSLS
jgi:hypothetical protein